MSAAPAMKTPEALFQPQHPRTGACLSREMLQAQLGYEHPGELAGLHWLCAAWYAQAGRVPEGIQAQGRGKETAQAAPLI